MLRRGEQKRLFVLRNKRKRAKSESVCLPLSDWLKIKLSFCVRLFKGCAPINATKSETQLEPSANLSAQWTFSERVLCLLCFSPVADLNQSSESLPLARRIARATFDRSRPQHFAIAAAASYATNKTLTCAAASPSFAAAARVLRMINERQVRSSALRLPSGRPKVYERDARSASCTRSFRYERVVMQVVHATTTTCISIIVVGVVVAIAASTRFNWSGAAKLSRGPDDSDD